VTYSKESKNELLGIQPSLLAHNGAVSEVVARAMAEGALKRSRADIAIGITGFAGPAGPGHEEGLVHMALARRDRATIHREAHFGARGRGVIRIESLKAMLQMLERAFEEE
jgi:nicotinamide-nucleotide amidase